MARDYYKILGVDRNATQEEIKRAFKRLARKYHPDIAGKQYEEKFKEINEAFQVLSDPQKRAQYDRFGSESFRQGDFTDFRNFNFEDIFRDFGFSDIFNIFSNGREERNKPRKGEDIEYDLDISLEQAFSGMTTTIEFPVHVICKSCRGTGAKNGNLITCPNCGGSGQIKKVKNTFFGQSVFVTTCNRCGGLGKIAAEICPICKGKGRVRENRRVQVKIPRGVDEGSYIKIPGQGEAGYKGGPPGDLHIVIHVKPHKIFDRIGNNLFCKTTISLPKAILGGEITVKTIDGEVKLTLPKGTQSHTVFRLRGLGMPDVHTGKRGDQLVKVIVEIPKKLTKKQEEILKNFFEEEETKTMKGFFEKMKDFLSS